MYNYPLVGTVTVVAIVGLLVASAAPAVASDHPGTVTVDVEADGDATVTISYRFDLTSTAEQQAFEELTTDEGARSDLVQRFEDRLSAVADASANATGREMAITDVAMTARTEGETGIVDIRATWTNIAAIDDTRLTVTEPFASGFETGRTVRIVGPEDATIASVSPSPDDRSGATLVWNGGTDLTELEAAFEVQDGPAGGETTAGGGDEQTDTTDGGGPGFGLAAALAALAGMALLARRRL